MNEPSKSSPVIIDRRARKKLVVATERFLAEKSTAFEFDDEIFAIADKTHDATVKELVFQMWHFYDDCKDHHVALNRQAWGYYQRMLLLLQSDFHMQVDRGRRWLPSQLAAAGALAAILGWALLCIHLRVEAELLIWPALAFSSLAVIVVYRWNDRLFRQSIDPYTDILCPFGSFAELAEVRRRVTRFRKQRYPEEIAGRRVREPLHEKLMWLTSLVAVFFFSPIMLILLSLPARRSTSRVVGCAS